MKKGKLSKRKENFNTVQKYLTKQHVDVILALGSLMQTMIQQCHQRSKKGSENDEKGFVFSYLLVSDALCFK